MPSITTITEMTAMLTALAPRPLMPQEINDLSAELGEHVFKTEIILINKDNLTSEGVMIYFDHSANMFAIGDVHHKLETYIPYTIIKTLVRCGII